LLPCTYVVLSKLILLELTFSLVPSPLLLLASGALKFLHSFLCIEDIKCYLFWVTYIASYLPCVHSPSHALLSMFSSLINRKDLPLVKIVMVRVQSVLHLSLVIQSCCLLGDE
jgi:hypothetical protein